MRPSTAQQLQRQEGLKVYLLTSFRLPSSLAQETGENFWRTLLGWSRPIVRDKETKLQFPAEPENWYADATPTSLGWTVVKKSGEIEQRYMQQAKRH